MEKDEELEVGKIIHCFPKIGVAIIKVTDASIKVGDEIHIKGRTTDFRQKVDSMQVEHEKIEIAESGLEIGLKVEHSVRENDLVLKPV